MGSDGLFDNVWPNEILNFVNQNAPNPMVMAKGLAKIAYEHSQDDSNYVPFFHRAKEADVGFSNYQGGKEDDITALIGIVN